MASAAASGLLEAAPAAAQPLGDAAVLERVIEVEQVVVVAYRAALAAGALEPAVATTVQTFLRQELEHVATLTRAVTALGSSAPPAPGDLATAQRRLARHHMTDSLTDLSTQKRTLRLLVDVETVAEDAYFVAIGKLSDPALLRTSAQIMSCEAQHWTVLSAARHHDDVKISVPYPFVGGTS